MSVLAFAPGAVSADPPVTAPPFAIEPVLSFPFPLEIAVSRTGARVAWIADRRGEIHGFLRFASWVRAETATAEFFDRRSGGSAK